MLACWLLRAVTFAAVIVCASVPDSNAELGSTSSSTGLGESAETATKKTAVSEKFSDLAGMTSDDASTVKPYANDSNGARQGSEHKENVTASKTETKVASGDGAKNSNSGLSSNSETESSMHLTSGRKEKSSSANTNSVTTSDETGSKTNRDTEDKFDSSSEKKKSSISNKNPASSRDMTQVAGAMSSSGDDTQEASPSDDNVKQENDDDDDDDEDRNAAAKMTKAKRDAAKEARYKAQAERKAKHAAQKKEWRKIKERHKAELKAAKARARSDTSAIHGVSGNATETALQGD